MDNSLRVNQGFQPTFGTVNVINMEKMLPSRRKIAEQILNKLQEVVPTDTLRRTYADWADALGYDIFVRNNERKGGIRVDAVTKRQAQNYLQEGWDIFDSKSYVNIYKNEKSFNPEDVRFVVNKNVKEKRDKKISLGMLAATIFTFGSIIFGTIIANKCTGNRSAQAVLEDTTELVKDTAKVVKENVQDFREPVINNTKRAIKNVK